MKPPRPTTSGRQATKLSGRARKLERRVGASSVIQLTPTAARVMSHAVLYKAVEDTFAHIKLDLTRGGTIRECVASAYAITNLAATTIDPVAPFRSDPFVGDNNGFTKGPGGGTQAFSLNGTYMIAVTTDEPGDTVSFSSPFTAAGEDFGLDGEYGHTAYFLRAVSAGTTVTYACTGSSGFTATRLGHSGTVSLGSLLGTSTVLNENVIEIPISGASYPSQILIAWMKTVDSAADGTDMTNFPRGVTDAKWVTPNVLFGWVMAGSTADVSILKPQYFRDGSWRDFPV